MNQKAQLPINDQKANDPKPNEKASFVVDTFVKIFDPNTKEILVEKRE